MASELSPPLENGKELAIDHPRPLSIRPSTPGTNEITSPVQEDVISFQSRPTVIQKAPLLHAAVYTSRSLIPYVPCIYVRQSSASDTKVIANGSCTGAAEPELDVEEDKKREKEHKKRSKNWTRPETLNLIKSRSELAPRFARNGRKSELWDEIADTLQSRDAQQCRDKWEKLMAGYKEVRDGLKEREDNPFFDELHPLLSGNSSRREKERDINSTPHENAPESLGQRANSDTGRDLNSNIIAKDGEKDEAPKVTTEEQGIIASERVKILEGRPLARKRKRGAKFVTVTDLHAVHTLLETVISRQQRFFRDLLEAMERKEQVREQMRHEREDKWRAEERAQRCVFNNAMLVLTQKFVGDRVGATAQGASASLVCIPVGHQGTKKRSKNWKRTEVLQLIKLRGEMESRFAKSTRRAALWDELAELLGTQGVKRDGKQCREKWDKLMSEYKDVLDGKREQGDSPYTELTAVVGRKPGEAG